MSTFARATARSLTAAACCTLAACATTGDHASNPPPARGTVTTDQAYVAAVERIARMRGILVQWVNPPSRREPQRTEP